MPEARRPGVALLLRPKWLTARSRLTSKTGESRTRWMVLAVLAAAFWVAVFTLFGRLLRYFAMTPDLGQLLAAKLLGLVLTGFFSILLLSNVIAALSSFFLARDLDLIVAAPVPWRAVYAAKLVETIVSSSWMVALVAVPLITAYGVVYHGGPAFGLLAAAVFLPFVALPGAVGSAVTLFLVTVFPARRTRDILTVVAVLTAAGLVVLFRLVRPERLARPEGFQSLTAYLATLQAPTAPWMPSEWAQRELMSWLTGPAVWRPLGSLWAAALAAVAVGAALHRVLYARAFSTAQVGRVRSFGAVQPSNGQAARRAARPGLRRGLAAAVTAAIGVQRSALVRKEILVFFRDATQWSQLVLLAVLIVVYVFNVQLLPVTGEGVSFFLRNAIPFLNLLLAGFVLASIAARFIFPSVSLEGRTLWLLRASPLSVPDLLWAKYWVGTLPLLVLANGLIAITDVLLHVSPFILVVSIGSITMLTGALAALALCFGTIYPRFETENAAQIPTSFGGLMYMMAAVTLLVVVILVEARPVYLYLANHTFGRRADATDIGDMVASFVVTAGIRIAATLVPLHIALDRLETLERPG